MNGLHLDRQAWLLHVSLQLISDLQRQAADLSNCWQWQLGLQGRTGIVSQSKLDEMSMRKTVAVQLQPSLTALCLSAVFVEELERGSAGRVSRAKDAGNVDIRKHSCSCGAEDSQT